MSKKFHIKKGDLVQVNAGEDRGKQGKVLEMIPDKQRAIVEGINLVSKHTIPTQLTRKEELSRRKLLFTFPT